VSLSSQCRANTSELAIIDASTGTVHLVSAARLVTTEDAGWILWLSAGQRLLVGALSYSYVVDASTYAARPFFFFPQVGNGPNADHDIMNTPDVNFSAVLLPAKPARGMLRLNSAHVWGRGGKKGRKRAARPPPERRLACMRPTGLV
jgi:hypothetical protein